MKTMKIKALIVAALMLAVVFTSCEKSDNAGTGQLRVLLTDAPFPTDSVEEANVVINKIEIRKANNGDGEEESEEVNEDKSEGESENEGKGKPFVVLSEEEMSFNLLDLTNGVTATLVDMEIEAGSYNLIRLYVAEASIKLKDGTEYDLKVPSGAQSGIKIFIKPAIVVAGGLSADLLLDFDVSKSFVVNGDPETSADINGFIFKPVIKATNNSTAGSLAGVVTDGEENVIDGAQVSVIAADTVYTTSFTDEAGAYTVLGIEAGIYSIEFAKEGYETVSVEGVQIEAANTTIQDAVLAAVAEQEAAE